MILIGQYDSPFVRRVGIALRQCQVPFEHRPWSVWGNAEQIAQYNPLRRVPTVLLEDGGVLVESFSILDYIDELVGPGRALLPEAGPGRRDGLKITAFCTGICDKAVSLLYSSLDLIGPTETWSKRCQRQIADTFAALEADYRARGTRYFLGEKLSHADIALGCAYRFTSEAHPKLFQLSQYSALTELAAHCESLQPFRDIYLPITNNL